jgi:HEAT repeat protein
VRIAAFKAAALLHLPLQNEMLIGGLEDDAWQVRAQAALAAGKIKKASVVPHLGACLSDRSWWVRNNAGTALFNCGRPGVEELERVIEESDDPFARDMAMRTLTSDPLYHVLDRGASKKQAIRGERRV